MTKARYIMIGGFLGAGKTTALSRLARELTDQGLKVGLITNDQGSELVDTATLRSRGFDAEEIAGGCFCCRFNSLVDAARKLSTSTRPDVFIAEPVGSCTDLVATVTYPLRRIYGEEYSVAPLSVMLDPIRALRVLGQEPGATFSEKVRYIYRKQLEEADLIVVNKCDLVEDSRQAELKGALNNEFPGKKVIFVSARSGANLSEWFGYITAEDQADGKSMEIDYELYAEGEALLGWLNCTIEVSAGAPFDGNSLLHELAATLQKHVVDRQGEVAHLKMTLSPDRGFGEIAVVNLVRNDFVPELSQRLGDEIESAQIILNLRAEADPVTLKALVEDALAVTLGNRPGLKLQLEHIEHFRPGKPQPTHRLKELCS